MIPLLGFAPDADATTPGVLTDCTNFIPYVNGMEGGPAGVTPSDVPALASECLGAAVVTKLSGSRRVFAGAATKLYELNAGSWDDVSAATYNAASDFRWSFTQFGDTSLASNKRDAIQSSSSGAFAAVASAPKAEIIFSVGFQVMALNVDDGTDKPDGWHVCALNDASDWTASLTTQAAKGRLVSTPGAITAGGRLGEFAVAYKARSMYLGRYVGAPSVWDWTPVANEVGCVGKEAWCDIGGPHFFVGEDSFWLFDGTRPVSIGDGVVRQWFYDNSSPQYRYRTKCVFDRQNSRIWVFFPSNASATCDSALVYHVQSKKWGRSNQPVEAVLNYIVPGLTFSTWDDAGATFDSLPNVSFDSQYWLAGGQALSAVNSSHQLQNMTGASVSSGFVTGDMGDDSAYTLLSGVRLRFAPGYKPTSASVQMYSKANSGDSYTTRQLASMTDGKFDVMVEDRWHKAEFTFSGPVRVTGGGSTIEQAGDR